MAGVEEQSRRRVATVLTLVGLGLILTGTALLLYQHHQIQRSSHPTPHAVEEPGSLALAHAIQRALFLLILLVGVFAVASYAFIRWSRRYRQWLLRTPPPATPDEDVWAMHRLPDEEDEDQTDATRPEEGPA